MVSFIWAKNCNFCPLPQQSSDEDQMNVSKFAS